MKKNFKRVTSLSLLILSLGTLINFFVLFFFPTVLPVSSFLAIKLLFIAAFDQTLYFLPIGLLPCVLMILAAISIRKNGIILPILALTYFILDLISALYMFVINLNDGFLFLVQFIQSILCCWVVSSLIIYLRKRSNDD
jgi:hypothetical protein